RSPPLPLISQQGRAAAVAKPRGGEVSMRVGSPVDWQDRRFFLRGHFSRSACDLARSCPVLSCLFVKGTNPAMPVPFRPLLWRVGRVGGAATKQRKRGDKCLQQIFCLFKWKKKLDKKPF